VQRWGAFSPGPPQAPPEAPRRRRKCFGGFKRFQTHFQLFRSLLRAKCNWNGWQRLQWLQWLQWRLCPCGHSVLVGDHVGLHQKFAHTRVVDGVAVSWQRHGVQRLLGVLARLVAVALRVVAAANASCRPGRLVRLDLRLVLLFADGLQRRTSLSGTQAKHVRWWHRL
jgi:hypothetical protein